MPFTIVQVIFFHKDSTGLKKTFRRFIWYDSKNCSKAKLINAKNDQQFLFICIAKSFLNNPVYPYLQENRRKNLLRFLTAFEFDFVINDISFDIYTKYDAIFDRCKVEYEFRRIVVFEAASDNKNNFSTTLISLTSWYFFKLCHTRSNYVAPKHKILCQSHYPFYNYSLNGHNFPNKGINHGSLAYRAMCVENKLWSHSTIMVMMWSYDYGVVNQFGSQLILILRSTSWPKTIFALLYFHYSSQ